MRADRLKTADLQPWVELRFARSGGPGGQNVNKVSTRVTLLLDFQSCPLLTPAQKRRISQRFSSRISRDGRLRVVSQKARTQAANRVLAGQRLLELLGQALRAPKPRRPTQPTPAARQRRLDQKRRRGELKQLRRSRPAMDE